MSKSLQSWAGELVGTFMFVSIICASVVLTSGGLADGGLVLVGLAHFLALAAVGTTFGAVSGGHFNPAVTFSAWIGRKISAADAMGYVAAQVLGALGAAVFLRTTFETSAWQVSNIATPALGPNISSGQGFLLEVVLTFFLVMVIWGTGIDERAPKVGALSIGGVLGGMILAFGPLTGVGLNPARYLGPAAVSSSLDDWWIYIVAPLVGAALAGIVYQGLWGGGLPWTKAAIGIAPVAPDPEPEPVEELDEAPARRAPAKKAPARRPATSERASRATRKPPRKR